MINCVFCIKLNCIQIYRYEGFADSEEAQLVGNVLNYYDQCDGDTVAQLCKNPLFKYLDNDVRIASIIHFLKIRLHWTKENAKVLAHSFEKSD